VGFNCTYIFIQFNVTYIVLLVSVHYKAVQFWPIHDFINFQIFFQVSTLARLSPDPHCHTQCGDGGCHCVANLLPLSQMDHLLLVTDSGQAVSCLCGDFQVSKYVISIYRNFAAVRKNVCLKYALTCTNRFVSLSNCAQSHYQKSVLRR
jgi:hypothetical protein